MLLHPTFEVCGASGVERSIAATQYVHKRHVKIIELIAGQGYGHRVTRELQAVDLQRPSR